MDDLIFEKFDKMEPSKAIELIHFLLISSNSWERNIKAIDKLILLKDNKHFHEIVNLYTNEMHPNVKIKLIKIFNIFYKNQGKQFIKEQYKKEKDWRVRKAILNSIELAIEDLDIEFFINCLKDSNISSCLFFGIPIPLSDTETSTLSSRSIAFNYMQPFSCVNFRELLSRLYNICFILNLSACTSILSERV